VLAADGADHLDDAAPHVDVAVAHHQHQHPADAHLR